MVNTVLSTAFLGLQNAVDRVNRAAGNLVDPQPTNRSGVGGASMPQDIVDLKIGEAAYKANIAVIKTADEMQDELLKTFDEKV